MEIRDKERRYTTTATPITAGSKSTSPTVLGTVGFKSLVIAGSSPPVPEPLVMCTHHRRFVSGTGGEELFPIKKIFSYNNIASFVQHI